MTEHTHSVTEKPDSMTNLVHSLSILHNFTFFWGLEQENSVFCLLKNDRLFVGVAQTFSRPLFHNPGMNLLYYIPPKKQATDTKVRGLFPISTPEKYNLYYFFMPETGFLFLLPFGRGITKSP